jgi:hypothetical protein
MFLLEDLPPKQNKLIAVAPGRFSVPTEGHYKVINKMKEFIRKNKHLGLEITPVILIIDGEESRKDKDRNPLTPHDRIEFMKGSGKANGVIFIVAKNIFSGFIQLRLKGYEPIAIAAGSDRAQSYKELLDDKFTDGNKSIEHIIIPGLERNNTENKLDKLVKEIDSEKEISDKNISSSLAKHAVQLDYLDVFTKIVGLEHKPSLAKLMFNKIKKVISNE